MINWIKNNKVPAIILIAMIIVAGVFGIWQGATYLQDEFSYFDLEPARGFIERPVTKGVVYHHTASGDVPISRHHEFHLSRGWVMVGYHFHIRQDGTIEVGRPLNVQGAHVVGKNASKIGVAFAGNMQNHPPTEEQYESAAELHHWLETEEGMGYGNLTITGHNDWASTACPGRLTNLNIIREGVIELRLEEEDPLIKGIIINSFADFPVAEPLAIKINAPIYLRGMDIEYDKAIIIGGGVGGINAEKAVDLSGSNRYETAQNTKDFIDQTDLEFDLEDIEEGVVINSFADFPSIEPLSHRFDIPIFIRQIDATFETAIVAGGGIEGIVADNIVKLSGQNRYETAENIYEYLTIR